MLGKLEKDRREFAHSRQSLAQNLQKELAPVERKLERLLNAYISGDLELESYRAKKKELLEKKVSLKDRLANFGQGTDYWLEPMREWILSSQNAKNLSTPAEKRNFWGKIGSNFILAGQRARFSVLKPFDLFFAPQPCLNWCARRELNPCYGLERAVT